MNILNFTSAIGLLGLILYLIGRFNKSKSWSKLAMNIGISLIAIHLISDAALGAFDGISGNPHR